MIDFEDFTGGMTDFPIDCARNEFERAKNFFIGKDRKLQTRYGSERDSTSGSVIPSSPTRVGALMDLSSTLLRQAGRNVYYRSSGVMTSIAGPSSNPVFGDGDDSNAVSYSLWNKHVFTANDAFTTSAKPMMIYKNSSGTPVVRNLGLPSVVSAPTISGLAAGSTYTYLYRFFYKYTYTNEDGITFEMVGPATEVSTTSSSLISAANPATIAMPGLLSNGAIDNYDVESASFTLEAYRTEGNGTYFYHVKSQPLYSAGLPVTDFQDDDEDTAIITATQLYTDSGEVESGTPPVCKIIHATQEYAYYAHILEGGETLSDEIRQSKISEPWAVPGSFRANVGHPIVGVSSVRSVPIVFCSDGHIYRIDGVFDDFGQGGMFPVEISSTHGGINQGSIVQTKDWIYFGAEDGFYRTNGYDVFPISEKIPNTYKRAVQSDTQKKRIIGAYDSKENRIWWAVNPESAIDNNAIFVAHLDYMDNKNAAFTDLDGASLDDDGDSVENDWSATALLYFNNKMHRGTADGYVMVHDEELYSDEKLSGSDWIGQTIQYDYKGAVSSGEAPGAAKWGHIIELELDEVSNISMQLQVDNNKKRNYRDLSQIYIKFRRYWGDGEWGDDDLWDLVEGIDPQKRGVPAGMFKFFYRQIRMKNGFFAITSSDLKQTGSISGTTTKTITLPTLNFPLGSIDYYIQIVKSDGSLTPYLPITAQSSQNVLTFTDSDQVAPTGDDKRWVITGYQKGDGLKILRYSMLFSVIPSGQQGSRPAQGGLS